MNQLSAKARKGNKKMNEKLIGLLQEKYGYTREQAEEEWEKRTK
jgi:uncharacterized protein (DUF2141 family)